MLQFPKLIMVDCDLNLDGPEKFLREVKKKDLDYRYVQVMRDEKGEMVAWEKAYDRLLDLLDKEVRPAQDKLTVAIDGLTPINEMIIRKILHEQKKNMMDANLWSPFKTKLLELMFGKLRSLGADVIVSCHEVILTKPKAGQVMQEEIIGYRPSVQGGVTDYFGGFFTDMWRTFIKPLPGLDKFEGWVRTIQTPQSDLKNSLGMPSEVKADWETIRPYWERKTI